MTQSVKRNPTPGSVKIKVKRILHFPLTRIVVGCVVVFFAGLITKWITMPILGSIGLEEEISKTIRYLLCLASVLAAYYWLFTYYENRKVTELAARHFFKDSLLGTFLAILSMSLVILILYLGGYYQVISINSISLMMFFPLIAFALSSTLEELLFRGVLYRIVESKLGTNLALLISSLLFGLVHITNDRATIISVIGAGIGGAITGMMFSSTRRLWLPISFHVFWNFTQVFYGVRISGMDEFMPYSLFQARFQGSELLTGGPFGPENSVITIMLTLGIFVCFYLGTWKRGRLIKPSWKTATGD